jgi:3-deoxy-D-manno-octulosonate 8-phosphate phosphatase (KDO 8-P phosphatase)
MEINYKNRLQQTTTFLFDVDGVFTDNTVLLMPDGEQIRTAFVRDGYAVQLAVKKGLRIVIISGGKSEGVRKRFEYLGVEDVFLGIGNKLDCFRQFILDHRIDPKTCCYMGDDIPDLDVMSHVGLAVCPNDAVSEIKQLAHYISPFRGGQGCVRDILEQALKIKGLWLDEESKMW